MDTAGLGGFVPAPMRLHQALRHGQSLIPVAEAFEPQTVAGDGFAVQADPGKLVAHGDQDLRFMGSSADALEMFSEGRGPSCPDQRMDQVLFGFVLQVGVGAQTAGAGSGIFACHVFACLVVIEQLAEGVGRRSELVQFETGPAQLVQGDGLQ